MSPLGSKIRWLAIFVGLFALFAAAALYRGLDYPVMYAPGAKPGELVDSDLRWSAEQILANGGNADHETYLQMARDLLETGGFEKYQIGIWPPGMPLVIATVLTLFGGDYYFLKLILVTCFAWTLMVVCLASAMPLAASRALSACAYGSIILLPVMRNWTFGYGSVMSEGIGCALFVMGLGMLARGLRTRERRWFVYAGVLFGSATYFRVFFRYAAEGIFGVSAAVIIFAIVWKHRRLGWREIWNRLRPGPSEHSASWIDKRLVHYLLLGLVASMLTIEPLRMYKLATIRTRSLYVMSKKDRLGHLWEYDHEVPGYIHGANAACRADPERCAFIHANEDALTNDEFAELTYATFLAHPVSWTAFKLSEIDWLWFGRSFRELVNYPVLIAEGVLLFLMGIGGFVWLLILYVRTRRPEYFLLGLAIGSFLLVNAGVFTFFHYEWRYSQPLRLLAFFLPFFVWSLRRQALHSSVLFQNDVQSPACAAPT